MPCKITTPPDPNGSSWRQLHASDWSKMETKRLNSSCSRKDHEDIIIESQRIRRTKGTEQTHWDHIADRGPASMSHCNMVHLPIPIPKTMIIPEAKAALDKEGETCSNYRFRTSQKVKRKTEMIRRATLEGKKVHVWNWRKSLKRTKKD